jgi:hypothetical protein
VIAKNQRFANTKFPIFLTLRASNQGVGGSNPSGRAFQSKKVSTIMNVIGLHAWQYTITKNVCHPTKSRLIYRDSTEPTPPPVENASPSLFGIDVMRVAKRKIKFLISRSGKLRQQLTRNNSLPGSNQCFSVASRINISPGNRKAAYGDSLTITANGRFPARSSM